ncbi:MAG: OmpA family protein [Rubritepida sp.]|jgi:OOP family OmpA-OmpF porin|nr:OmpA family protein [Rubritepida sp.]MCU0943985.1 OmpA family protein [Rubritepida sp.]
MPIRWSHGLLAAVLLAAPLVAAPGLAPPALAQPAAQAPHGSDRAFIVFFEAWSALIDEPARAGIARVAQMAQGDPRAPVLVIGFASPPGGGEANDLLSKLRARVVADALIERGVAADRVRVIARGATPGMESLESRRVEVRLDDGRN